MQEKLWIYQDSENEMVKSVCAKTGISPLLAKVLVSRGMTDGERILKFLNPTLLDLHNPFLLEDMDKAVERICHAISGKEKMVIYGDYDVDGVTSTSTLYNFLKKQNADIDFYIPDRLDEGYGLSMGAMDKVIQMGPSLIITVDCGITAFDEITYVRRRNIDVIITDHHECRDELPQASAVINPCRHDCRYPFKALAGVGVVFKLIHALCITLKLGDEFYDYLDLAALGTVADVVPLTDENRVIVKYGIEKMERTSNPGLKAIVNCAGLNEKPINSWGIGFAIAPRINAAGRLGDAARAVKLFTTADEQEAKVIAQELDDENKSRQDLEAEILAQVLHKIETEIDLEKEKVIVVASEGWHHGIIGIVASRIIDKYYRPCILLCIEEGVGKGSGRSIEGFNLYNALVYCESLLEKYGGHELAAGISLKEEHIPAFRKMINCYADDVLHDEVLVPKLRVDIKLCPEDVSISNVRGLELLTPFGTGNPSPVFVYENIMVEEIRTVGENKHLKLMLCDKKLHLDAIGFHMGDRVGSLDRGDVLDIAGSLEVNVWNSIQKVQINLKDLRPGGETLLESEYFYSLDQSIGLICFHHKENSILDDIYINNRITKEGFWEKLSEALKTEKKVAILINSLESAVELENSFKKSILGIKKAYKVCYTGFNNSEMMNIRCVINPKYDDIDLEGIDEVIFYGGWIHPSYLKGLMSKVDPEKTSVYNLEERSFNTADFIPERQDLAVIYQYFKVSSRDNELYIDDLFVFACHISNKSRVHMNYFKVKKCIEIFEELNLIQKELFGKCGMHIIMRDNRNKKESLESSMIYMWLQGLKNRS